MLWSSLRARAGPLPQEEVARSCHVGEKTKLAITLLHGASLLRCCLLRSQPVPAWPEFTPLMLRINLSQWEQSRGGTVLSLFLIWGSSQGRSVCTCV